MIRRFFVAFVFVSFPFFAQAAERPEPQIQRVLIISIDGLRPDVLLRAQTPTLHHMMQHGSFSMWARTTAASITLPSHVSMMTGVVPEVHAILWNADLPLATNVYPASPTLFELARKAGYSTALAAGKSKFSVFDKPATEKSPAALTWKFITTSKHSTDAEVIEHALDIVHEHQPQVMLIHLPECDNVGHASGWGTPEQIATIEQADAGIARLVTELTALQVIDSTLLIVTSDHGGAGRTHGPEDARSRTIPWIATGPGVRQNFDLTRLGRDIDITTFDTFATACYVLGIAPPSRIDGKAVVQIFENQEMMISTFQPQMAPATLPAVGGH